MSCPSPKAKRRLEMDPVVTAGAMKRRRLSSTSTSDEGRKDYFNCLTLKLDYLLFRP